VRMSEKHVNSVADFFTGFSNRQVSLRKVASVGVGARVSSVLGPASAQHYSFFSFCFYHA
jgi:hypothetical protein